MADALRGAQSMDLQVKVLSVLKTVIHRRYEFFSDDFNSWNYNEMIIKPGIDP